MLTVQPEFHYFFTAKGVNSSYHISCLTPGKMLVSDVGRNLIMTNTTGDVLHRYNILSRGSLFGFHTVNNDGELFYIGNNYCINKLSNDMKETITFIDTTNSIWRPWCVYWSPSTGDLLVGMNREYKKTGKVTRYNKIGQLTQIIQQDNTGIDLYCIPNYITENKNGDVVVCDLFNAVIVTEREGKHRFTYTGHPSEPELWPHGICTDALSRILVCDVRSNKIHIINKDGQFLNYFFMETKAFVTPYTLCFDINSNTLYVGSWNHNRICVYKNITQHCTSIDEDRQCTDKSDLFASRPSRR
nr:uncharacterized protein LOC117685429 isoform X2 [Crassostrea gigas]